MVIQVSFQAKSTILSGATKTRTREGKANNWVSLIVHQNANDH
jgi:hypothetical protein